MLILFVLNNRKVLMLLYIGVCKRVLNGLKISFSGVLSNVVRLLYMYVCVCAYYTKIFLNKKIYF